MLKLKNITKKYIMGDSSVDALKGVSLTFRDNEFVSILGPSGCGKTTLLNIIGGLDVYTDGDLEINGVSTKKYKDRDWDTYRNHTIGFVFQSYNLIPHQTVFSNVELALTLSGVSKKDRKKLVTDALTKVGLGDQLHKKPNQMSGGQMQRVAIARALVNNPDILLADEPTGALDSQTSVQIMEILKEISKDKLVIMVTHNPELAEKYSTRIVKLKDGLIVDDSEPVPDDYTGDESKKEQNDKETPVRHKKKSSMSFWTALSLSFNNLLTKKGRTFMTAFAGSIGIIGIALILALSNGVQKYIDDVQKDTLSSYPITIMNEEMDLSSIVESMSGNTSSDHKKEHEDGSVYADASAYKAFNTLFTQEKKKNNLKGFKSWLDGELKLEKGEGSGINQYASSIHYGYDVNLNTYVKDEKGSYRSTNISDIFSFASTGDTEAGGISSLMNSSMTQSSGSSLWGELLPGNKGEIVSDMIIDQFDIVAGRWPEKENEIVIRVSDNHEINDFAFYMLGKMSKDEVLEIMTAAMKQEEIKVTERKISYEDLLGITFKIVLSADLYQDSDKDGVYSLVPSDDSMLQLICDKSLDVKIVGIITKKQGVTATAFSGTFGYTSKLTQYIIEKTNESEVAKALVKGYEENKDIFSGLPYSIDKKNLSDTEKATAFADYVSSLTEAQQAELFTKIMLTPSQEYIDAAINQMLAASERSEMEALIANAFGYPVDAIKDYLATYTDEELKEMIAEQSESVVTAKYAEEAQGKLDEVINTPTPDELLAFKGIILQMAPTKQAQIGMIANSWSENGIMSVENAFAYISALDDKSFDELLNNAALKAYVISMENDETARNKKLALSLTQMLLSSDSETIVKYYDSFMPSGITEFTYEDNCKRISVCDIESPSTVSIYPATFEDKDRISEIIKEYNASHDKDDEISYTDYVALLMSGITTIINAISYVLIAFVAISLVVSSIMIGIITYISVLERTKEIGILRAVGASKKDVSRVFTAETLIVGLCAGIIGIGCSLLLCIPINFIVHKLTDIYTINAYIPIVACLVLVAISMALTLIAGFFPSRTAAKKDPVEALRTE